MKKIMKKVCAMSLCGGILLSGMNVFAMSGTADGGNISYYANIINSGTTVEASISTKKSLYPTALVKIWYSGGSLSTRGTSYASYCYVKSNAPGNKQITDNKVTFTAGSQTFTGKAN